MPAQSKPRILGCAAVPWARMRTLVSTGLTETAWTATRRSRAPGSGLREFEIEQGVRIGWRQGSDVADGFHEGSLRKGCSGRAEDT